MKQTGVEVRPLRQATGDARFNEVFITDARVPDTYRVGDLNKGWWVLQTALAYERVAMGGARRTAASNRPAPRNVPRGATAAAHGDIPSPDIVLVDLAKAFGHGGGAGSAPVRALLANGEVVGAEAVAFADVILLAVPYGAVPDVGQQNRWQGKIEQGDEAVLIVKTTEARYEALAARVLTLHPYDLPCLAKLPVAGGHAPYLDWIRAESRPR